MREVCITAEIEHSKLKKLEINKASGVDGIVSEILAENADTLSVPLCQVYSVSLDTGMVPQDWRRADVSAIFKKAVKSEAGNYRRVVLHGMYARY